MTPLEYMSTQPRTFYNSEERLTGIVQLLVFRMHMIRKKRQKEMSKVIVRMIIGERRGPLSCQA